MITKMENLKQSKSQYLTLRVVYSTYKYVTVDTENCKTDDEIVDLVCDQVEADALEIFYIDDEEGEPFYE